MNSSFWGMLLLALVLSAGCTSRSSEPTWPFSFPQEDSTTHETKTIQIENRWLFDSNIVNAISFSDNTDTLIHTQKPNGLTQLERRRANGSSAWIQKFSKPLKHLEVSDKGDVLFLETANRELIALGGSGHEMWRETMPEECHPRYLEEQQRILCSEKGLTLLHWNGRKIAHTTTSQRITFALDWKNSNHWATLSEGGELSLYPQLSDSPLKTSRSTKTQLFAQDLAWIERSTEQSPPMLAILGHPGLQSHSEFQRLTLYNIQLEPILSTELPIRFSNMLWDSAREHLYLSADLPRGQYLYAYTIDWEDKRLNLLWKTQHLSASRGYSQQFALTSKGTLYKVWTHLLTPPGMQHIARTYLVEHDPNTGYARRFHRFEDATSPVFLVTRKNQHTTRLGVLPRLDLLEWLQVTP